MKTANMNPQDYSRYQDEQVHKHFERLECESSIRKAAEDVKKAQSQGKTEGLAEGEAKSKVETLKKLLEMNQDYNLIFQLTEFSTEQIEDLLKDRDNLSLNASAMLGFDHDLLAVQDSEDIQISGDTDVLTDAHIM
jgi:flagellar biosynthesis/type III secretory pathway protein FliH